MSVPALPPAAPAAFGEGLLTMAGLIVAIGAQNAHVLRQGLRRAHVVPVVAFCTISDWLLVSAGVFGFGALLAQAAGWMQGMRLASAAFLGWSAWRAARRAWRGGTGLQADAREAGRGRTLASTAALTWLNPHVYLDTVVLLGTVGAQQAVSLRAPFALGAGTASALWFSALGFGAAVAAPRLAGPATWRVIDGTVAAVLAAIALQLLREAV
jgi:L-lysine exporter family protein LysE/ArgO